MYCASCGSQLHENTPICPQCGKDNASVANRGRGTPSPTYIAPAILVTIFCCQPFGIVAIVYAAIAMGKNSSNEYDAAFEAAKKAKMWSWIGFGVGFAFIAIYVVLMMLGIVASAAATP